MTNTAPSSRPPLTTDSPRTARPEASPALGAVLLAGAFGILSFLRNPPPEPARITPVVVDPTDAPWYILAAVDGVGARTARRWTTLRDGAAAAGIRLPPQDWPGVGPAAAENLARAAAASPEPPR
jgi:hypothetical protein